jgi:hypothetical protein
MTTWRELKAQGVKRCCARFTSDKQCRRRANAEGSWCDKHAAVIKIHTDFAKRAMAMTTKPQREDDDE